MPCFVCSSVDRHFGKFHVLAITDRATINLGVQRSLRLTDFISLGYKTSNGTAESHSSLFLVFGRTPTLVVIMTVLIYIPTNSAYQLPSLYTPTSFCYFIVVVLDY